MRVQVIYLIVVILAGTAVARKAPRRGKVVSAPVAESHTDPGVETAGRDVGFSGLNGHEATAFDGTDGPASYPGFPMENGHRTDLPESPVLLEETPAAPASPENTNENAESADATTNEDVAEGSDSLNPNDGELSGGRMLELGNAYGYSSDQQAHYSETSAYDTAPAVAYGSGQVGGFGSGQMGYLGNLGVGGVSAQAAIMPGATYGTNQVGNYGGQISGYGYPIGYPAVQPGNLLQQEGYTKVEGYVNTPPAAPATYPPVVTPPVNMNPFGSFGNTAAVTVQQGQVGTLPRPGLPLAPATHKEEVYTETEIVDDGKPAVVATNFTTSQFGNVHVAALPPAPVAGYGSIGGFGMGNLGGFGMGSLGGFGGFGGFGGMSMMMNPMLMNQFHQFSAESGHEEVGVHTSSHSESAYPVPMPIPFHMPHPQPYPVPVHTPYAVPIPLPHPYPVEKAVEVRVPVNRPVPYPVQQMVPIPIKELVTVNKPYPVHVPVEVEKPVKVEVPVPFPVPMYQQVKVPEPRPYPVHIRKNVPVPMPFPVPVPQPDMSHKMMC